MDLGLKGRVALVTGSSDGIGKEIAFTLASEGVDVIIHGRDPDKVAGMAEKIHEVGNRRYRFVADVTKPDQINNWFETKMPRIGRLDILVNNIGGIIAKKRFEEVTDEEWLDSFNFNFMTPVRFTRLPLPYLKKSNQARIINLSSVPAFQPGLYNPHYGAPKAALVQWNKSLSNELAEYGILVNVICPNTIMGGAWYRDVKNISETERLTFDEATEKLKEITKSKVPLKRVGTAEEVANMVVLLASKQASFVTGECIFVDGGTKKSIF